MDNPVGVPVGEISGARFEQIFMAYPGITAVPNTNPQIYTLPGETVIEVYPFDGIIAATPPGIYTVVNYNTEITRQEGLFGGVGQIIRGTPRFSLIDPTGTRHELLVGTNNVKIITINGARVPLMPPVQLGPYPPTPPSPTTHSPRPRQPCQEGNFRVARPYQQGRPEAPQAYSDCRNCNDVDPVSLEEIQSIPLDQLIVLPSGNCMKRSLMDRLFPLVDPLTRERIGGKNRKSRKRKSKKGKTKKKRLTKKRKH